MTYEFIKLILSSFARLQFSILIISTIIISIWLSYYLLFLTKNEVKVKKINILHLLFIFAIHKYLGHFKCVFSINLVTLFRFQHCKRDSFNRQLIFFVISQLRIFIFMPTRKIK